MAFRDEREALRARAERAEAELAALKAADPAPDGSGRAPLARASHALGAAGILIFLASVAGAAAAPVAALAPLLVMLAVVGLMLVPFGLLISRLRVVSPNELLVVSGAQRRLPDGTTRGYRVVRGGRTLLIPIIEREDWLSLADQRVALDVRSVLDRDGRRLRLEGTASVRIADSDPLQENAIQRFLGRDPEELRRVAAETIEGALRELVAKRTESERLAGDPQALATALLETGLEEDLARLGLVLDELRLERVEMEG